MVHQVACHGSIGVSRFAMHRFLIICSSPVHRRWDFGEGILRCMFGRTAIWIVLTVAIATLSMAVPQELPEGEGKKLLEERCSGCHDLKPVVSLRQGEVAWKELIVKMRGYGAQLDNKEVDVATEYLTKHFGPAAVKPDTPEEK